MKKIKKIKIAVVGFGNIGKAVCDTLTVTEDMELCGIVRRTAAEGETCNGIKVAGDIKKLGGVDVAILCGPSRKVPEMAEKYLQMGINTVDSFDIHGDIWDLKVRLDGIAKANKACSIISTGMDPGADSIIRALFLALTPKGITYTNFGPGMSMGHTVAVKAVAGVKAAMSMTIPAGAGTHNRMVYVEIEPGSDFSAIAEKIKNDPYFINDNTKVILVDNVNDLLDVGHASNIVRKGGSGMTCNQLLEFTMKINNPALTSQMLVSCARASMRQPPGCYTVIELPPINLLSGGDEQAIRALV